MPWKDVTVPTHSLQIDRRPGDTTRPAPRRWHHKEGIMPIHPLAGTPTQPSMLVNIPRLVTAYYTERPDPTVPEQRVALAPLAIAARPSRAPSTKRTSSP